MLVDGNPRPDRPLFTRLLELAVLAVSLVMVLWPEGELNQFVSQWSLSHWHWDMGVQEMLKTIVGSTVGGPSLAVLPLVALLHIFGPRMESRLGHFNFLLFFVSLSILANLFTVFAGPAAGVGVAGGMTALLAAYTVTRPFSQFRLGRVQFPAVLLTMTWFALLLVAMGPSILAWGPGILAAALFGVLWSELLAPPPVRHYRWEIS